MSEVLSVLVLLIVGACLIAGGIYLTFGAGPAIIALGISCLVAAYVTVRGLSIA